MNKNKIVISAITSSILMFNLTGCSIKDTVITKSEVENAFKKEQDKLNNKENNYAIKYIAVDDFLSKEDSLNREGIPKNMPYNINITKLSTLESVLKNFEIPTMADEKIKFNYVQPFHLQGTLEEVLDQLSSLSNTFWSVDKGVIKFSKTKTIVYKIPLMNNNKLGRLYNVGGNDNNKFDVDKITANVFTELETSLKMVLGNKDFEGTILSSNEVNKENVVKDNLEKILKQENKNTNNKKEIDSITEDNLNQLKNENKKDNLKDKLTNNDTNNGVSKPGDTNVGFSSKMSTNSSLRDKNTEKLQEAETSTDAKNKVDKNSNENISDKINTNENNNNKKSVTELNNGDKSSNKYELKTIYKGRVPKVAYSSEAGIFVVEVDRDEESKVDNVINNLIKNTLNTMVEIEFNIMELTDNNQNEFNMNLTAVANRVGGTTNAFGYNSRSGMVLSAKDAGTKFGANQTDFITTDTLGNVTSFVDPISKRFNVGGLIDYITSNENTKILSQPKILSMPNQPTRIKATVDVPYIEPELTGGDSSELTYSIKFVNDGLDMAVVTNVIDDRIYVSLGISINQYLSDKLIKAGSLGDISIPVQAPRIINNTLSIKAGDSVVIGGLKDFKSSYLENRNLLLPTGNKKEIRNNEIVIVASAKLIKFVKKDEMKKIIAESKNKFSTYEKSGNKYDNDKIVQLENKIETNDVLLKEQNELNLSNEQQINKLERELGQKIQEIEKLERNSGKKEIITPMTKMDIVEPKITPVKQQANLDVKIDETKKEITKKVEEPKKDLETVLSNKEVKIDEKPIKGEEIKDVIENKQTFLEICKAKVKYAINLRDKRSSKDSKVIGRLNPNQEVEVEKTKKDWFKLKDTNSYVYSESLILDEKCK